MAAVLVAGAILTGVVACNAKPVVKADPMVSTTSAAPSSTPKPTPPPPPIVWPLTGVVSGKVAPRPAVAVKIENSLDARPQTGLDSADMVWEEVVEGGITRYVAVFHSRLPSEIGPVRSVRPMDPFIVAPLHGLLAFSGGQPGFVSAVSAGGIQAVSMDSGDGGFYRVSRRSAPHNVYASLQTFLSQANAGHRAAPPAQFRFAGQGQQPTAVATGRPTAVVNLQLSGVGHPNWTWSPAHRAWMRDENGTPAVVASGNQLGATNVVVLRVNLVNTGTVDPAGNPVPETQLTGSGQALVASGGHSIGATWTKPSGGALLALTGVDGKPITLAPGNTWIELVPNGSGAVARH
jgi:hypothetical protein